MDMGMKFDFLIPGVQHAEEAEVGAEMSGSAGDFEQGFGTGAEQQAIEELAVLPRQGCQLVREGEDDMDVGRREKFLAPGLEPTVAGVGLTLRAMAIATAVIGDGGAVSTAGALIDMAAEGGGATARDGEQDLDMRPADPLAAALDEGCAGSADQIGHLQGRPVHLLLLG